VEVATKAAGEEGGWKSRWIDIGNGDYDWSVVAVCRVRMMLWLWYGEHGPPGPLDGGLHRRPLVHGWERPPQDLRWSLKMGVSSSIRVEAPSDVPTPAGSEVIAFGSGGHYFLRELQTTECLHLLDVPERYFKHRGEEERRSLLEFASHPLKIMQEVAERIDIWSRKREDSTRNPNKRVREVSELKSVRSGEESHKRVRSHETEVTVERSTQEEGERDAKASKADNDRIPIEIWDSFLERGLPPSIQRRDWKPAAVMLRK
jgi:hypothetical protein